MSRRKLPQTVIEGEIQYLSASSIATGDQDSADGCLRKFWYEKVKRIRPPETEAQRNGKRLHAEIESFLRGESTVLGALAARGKFMLPTPGPDLFLEHDIVLRPESEGEQGLERAPLSLRGIPVVGYIDAFHSRCTNKGVSDIEETIDPPGTVEVIDWKTTSNVNYIKAPEVMARTVQMTVYGKWVTTVFPKVKHVRLSHGYFVTRGSHQPRKVTLRIAPEQLDEQWSRIERVTGELIETARETDAESVPANTRACSAFGGCPHRAYCRADEQESLAHFFGIKSAETMFRRMNMQLKLPKTETIDVAREEIECRFPGFPAEWAELERSPTGHPCFSGELARLIGELRGEMNVTEIAGAGELASSGPFHDPTDLHKLLLEVREFLRPSVPALLPPETPESNPLPPVVDIASAKRGRGRPKKEAVENVVCTPAAQQPGLFFYVNCAPSCHFESFWPHVHTLVGQLNQATGEVGDFRLVPNEHKFAYGRWRAALALALREGQYAGHYVFDGAQGEVGVAVTEVMRSLVNERGGVFVQ